MIGYWFRTGRDTVGGAWMARAGRSIVAGAALGFTLLAVTACHGLLDVSDPTLVQDQDLANSGGANARRLNTISNFSRTFGTAAVDVALFTDEQAWDIRFLPRPSYGNYYLDLDRRDSVSLAAYQAGAGRDNHLDLLDGIFSASSAAVNAVRDYGADSVRGEYLAQLFALRGYVILQMAEDLCSGFPINDISPGSEAVYSRPYSTDSATRFSLAQLDSAFLHGRDSTRFLNLARVVRARALLDLGQYEQIDSVLAPVPTAFSYTTDPGAFSTQDFVWSQNGCCGPVGNNDGGNGLPFVDAHDPRVPTYFVRFRQTVSTDSMFDQLKYPTRSAPIVVASGIEARLMEAEAALHGNDPAWLTILNTLRTTCLDASTCPSPPAGTGGVPGLAPLSDPGSAAARVDLLYRERAMWLYITGRRLGDLRRLVRNYSRDPETVFPSGSYWGPVGGTYGTITSIPFTVTAQGRFNPYITTGCTTR